LELGPRYTYHLLLSIEKLIYGGDGLARTPAGSDSRSMVIFVPFVLPGERVEANVQLENGRLEKSGFSRGSVLQLIEESPDRVEARCPYFRQCGGCHYQHIHYGKQLQFKAEILRETIQRIAKVELNSEIQMHASPPWNYRSRTRLRIRTTPEFALGYFRFGSREFLPVRECPIGSPLLNHVMARLLAVRGLNCPNSVEEIELFADAEDKSLLAWAFCARDADREELLRWAAALQRELTEIVGVTFFSSRQRLQKHSKQERSNANSREERFKSKRAQQNQSRQGQSHHDQSRDDEPVDHVRLAHAGADAIYYRTKHHEYRVSPGAFFQVNRYLIDDLISVVTGNARGEIALDLYAGVGLFSAVLARNFHHILGVEASQTSHADFVQNVPANVKVIGARTEECLSSGLLGPLRKNRPDLVVLDPPRAGAGKKVINSLLELRAPLIRYVSCDPATLARDLVPLLAAGYHVEEAHLFDLFPETFHIESVMLLAR
jgi:23S rRNA (uracil1939-C5)-methyltransferase